MKKRDQQSRRSSGLKSRSTTSIILFFSFYVWEMTAISLGVAAVSFGIGYFVRNWLGIEI